MALPHAYGLIWSLHPCYILPSVNPQVTMHRFVLSFCLVVMTMCKTAWLWEILNIMIQQNNPTKNTEAKASKVC